MIGCEGGPIIVANAEDFKHWRGSDPLPAKARRELHVWSAFTVELPERFRPAGPAGHQLIPGRDYDELVAMRRELVEFVQGRWPGSTVREEFETCTVTRPDGARLWVQLAPVSEYDRCIRDLDCIAAHRFDGERTCVVWSVGPGEVNIHRPELQTLELAQVFFADDDAGVAEALGHVQRIPREARADVLFDVTRGPVVVAWGPNSSGDYRGRVQLQDIGPADGGRVLDFAIAQSGAVLWLAPRRYRATVGEHEADAWGVRWCILRSEDGEPAEGGDLA
jgi:hypothetical protein